MRETFYKMRELLDADERRKAVLLFVMMLVMGLLETLGVGSVMPFVAVVANPEIVQTNAYLAAVYDRLGFVETNDFLVFLGVLVFFLVVGSLAFKALTQWAIVRYSAMRSYTLSSRLLRSYLSRPYTFFLNRHTADLGKSVLAEAGRVVSGVLQPGMQMVASTTVACCLIVMLVIVDPVVAVTAVAVLGGGYAVIYAALRVYIGRIGAEAVHANRERFRLAQEALGGIKDVKVLGLEDGYIRSFRRPASRFARTQANSKIIAQLPHFGLQALMFGGMLLLLVGLLVRKEGSLGDVLPVVVLYAVAGTRLLPALQEIYRSLAAMRFGKPALSVLYDDLAGTEPLAGSRPPVVTGGGPNIVRLRERLHLEHVRYTYPGAARPALRDIDFAISADTTVGLVGSTGAGKTTVVDLILGLLEPQRGRLVVDGEPIDGAALRAWQRNIGYVPQSIFLTDDSIAANIAFGVPNAKIDQAAVERAARTAELHEFVVNQMPDGYATLVGERGVRLSGGERQRIGIARALYYDPDVLILDEATSALDNLTERAVMGAVNNLGHRKTVIIVAHRLSTVRHCDVIFMFSDGRLVAQGPYDELLEKNDRFRSMAAPVH